MPPANDHRAEIRRLLAEATPAPATASQAPHPPAAIVITGGTVHQLVIVYGGSASVSQANPQPAAPSCPAWLARRRALLASLPAAIYKDKPK